MNLATAQTATEKIIRYLEERSRRSDAAAYLNVSIKGLRLQLDPAEDDLPTEMQRQTLRYWRGLPMINGIPDQLKVEPEALRPALGYLMLVDRTDSPCQFRYALYGSKIAAVSGFDMTGKSVWDIATLDEIQIFFAACYQAAVELRRPLFTVHEAPLSITISHWNRLILPLGQGGEIRRFLVCNVPIRDGLTI